jgi:hypothetical protein
MQVDGDNGGLGAFLFSCFQHLTLTNFASSAVFRGNKGQTSTSLAFKVDDLNDLAGQKQALHLDFFAWSGD